ncbi:MAG: hypothetical protein U1F25_00080 [Rubrivivax sp.]
MDSTHNAAALIGDTAGLAAYATRSAAAVAVGIDTEFMRERTYYAQLCLLQLTTAEGSAAADTLALTDLAALRLLLAGGVRKVLHAARQDLEVLFPMCGMLTGIYDTQVAAALVGMLPHRLRRPGAAAAGRAAAREPDAHRLSRRPLSPEQLDYALDDVRYLLPLRSALDAEPSGRPPGLVRGGDGYELDEAGSFAVDPAEAWKRLKGLAISTTAGANSRSASPPGASSAPWTRTGRAAGSCPTQRYATSCCACRATPPKPSAWVRAARGHPPQQRRPAARDDRRAGLSAAATAPGPTATRSRAAAARGSSAASRRMWPRAWGSCRNCWPRGASWSGSRPARAAADRSRGGGGRWSGRALLAAL